VKPVFCAVIGEAAIIYQVLDPTKTVQLAQSELPMKLQAKTSER